MTELASLLHEAFQEYRGEICRVVEQIRDLDDSERGMYEYVGFPLFLHPAELPILNLAVESEQYPSDWKRRVVESVVLAVLWVNLRTASRGEGRMMTPTSFLEIIKSADQDLRRLQEEVSGEATATVQEILESCARRHRRILQDVRSAVARERGLKEFVAPAREKLRAWLQKLGGDASGIVLKPLDTAGWNLSAGEVAALLGTGGSQSPSLAVLLSTVAAASFKTAEDFGWLSLPELEGAPPKTSETTDAEMAADVDAIETLSREVKKLLQAPRVRTDAKLLPLLTLIDRRLEGFVEAASDALGPAPGIALRMDFAPPVDVGEIPKELLSSQETEKAPAPHPTATVHPTTSTRVAGEGVRVNWTALAGATVLILGIIAMWVAIVVYGIGRGSTVQPPRPTTDASLAQAMPGAKILEATPVDKKSALIQIQVGPDWSNRTRAEQSKEVLGVCEVLSTHNYESAKFLSADGRVLAQWVNGDISFTEAGTSAGP